MCKISNMTQLPSYVCEWAPVNGQALWRGWDGAFEWKCVSSSMQGTHMQQHFVRQCSGADSQLYHWDQMLLSIPLSLHTSTDALSTWSFFISAAVCKKGEREREVVCGQVWWPILGICPLHLTHPSAHSQQWTHTRSSGQPYCGARGAVGGSVPCSRVKWGNRCLAPPTTPAGPGNRTCNLWVTSPTL